MCITFNYQLLVWEFVAIFVIEQFDFIEEVNKLTADR